MGKSIKTGAIFSDSRKYRYALWRLWDESRLYAMFIGLNPSTADETHDDPTIRRCIHYAKDWGYGGLYVVNLFAYRATKPQVLFKANDPVGADNDHWIAGLAKNAGIIIGAWGNHGAYNHRSARVMAMLPKIKCLKQNKTGEPSHPLYLPVTAIPVTIITAEN